MTKNFRGIYVKIKNFIFVSKTKKFFILRQNVKSVEIAKIVKKSKNLWMVEGTTNCSEWYKGAGTQRRGYKEVLQIHLMYIKPVGILEFGLFSYNNKYPYIFFLFLQNFMSFQYDSSMCPSGVSVGRVRSVIISRHKC